MENKDLPAIPVPITKDNTTGEHYGGLSKREMIAAMALQGLLSNPDYNCPSNPKNLPTTTAFATAALHYADALLTQLEK